MKTIKIKLVDNSEDLLTFVLDKLSKEDLQEIFNKTNIEI